MAIACNLLQERSLVESELKLLHASQRLRYIHSKDLVHMDLKSENISFPKISSTRKSPMPPSCSREPDPYSMDDSTLLLLVFIAIEAFIPYLVQRRVGKHRK
uniref:Protein kinase domain-containing protein n=1 Tax=Glossina palpalis gambiensis TaxID=67801 RepID=A0A1B0BXD8_9MUSC